jgi:hypothetical protein
MGREPQECMHLVQWQETMNMRRNKGFALTVRQFDEVGDACFVRMRMVAIWKAQETMDGAFPRVREQQPVPSSAGRNGLKVYPDVR